MLEGGYRCAQIHARRRWVATGGGRRRGRTYAAASCASTSRMEALLYRRRALGLHHRATSGLRGGDRRHKAWPPSTAGARMSSVVLLASLHRRAASGLRDGGHRRKASGLPPPPSHAWSPSTTTPPLASLHCRATSGLRGGDHRRLGGGGL
jgi:hypothetical protein